jgi:GxxExxY protein
LSVSDRFHNREGVARAVVDHLLTVQLKSVEKLAPVHKKPVLTYHRMTDLPVGFLISFGPESYKAAVSRAIDNHHPYHPPK